MPSGTKSWHFPSSHLSLSVCVVKQVAKCGSSSTPEGFGPLQTENCHDGWGGELAAPTGNAHSVALNTTLQNKYQTERMSTCLLCHLSVLSSCKYHVFVQTAFSMSLKSQHPYRPSSSSEVIYLWPLLSQPEFMLAKWSPVFACKQANELLWEWWMEWPVAEMQSWSFNCCHVVFSLRRGRRRQHKGQTREFHPQQRQMQFRWRDYIVHKQTK